MGSGHAAGPPPGTGAHLHTLHVCLYTAGRAYTGRMRRAGAVGAKNGQELIWVNIFEEELISVNIGGAYFSKGWSLFQ